MSLFSCRRRRLWEIWGKRRLAWRRVRCCLDGPRLLRRRSLVCLFHCEGRIPQGQQPWLRVGQVTCRHKTRAGIQRDQRAPDQTYMSWACCRSPSLHDAVGQIMAATAEFTSLQLPRFPGQLGSIRSCRAFGWDLPPCGYRYSPC